MGIGDRHLENVLLDVNTGSVVPIDFGRSFGIGVQKLPVPELFPFRMTRQFTNAFVPIDGNKYLTSMMVHVLSALRASQQMLLDCLEVFVHEPVEEMMKKPLMLKDVSNAKKTHYLKTNGDLR